MAKKSERIDVQVDKGIHIRMDWSAGEDLEPVFADQMHLTRLHDQYYLTFGQVRLLTGPAAPPEATEVRPVARLIIPKKAMEQLVRLLTRGIEEWGESQ